MIRKLLFIIGAIMLCGAALKYINAINIFPGSMKALEADFAQLKTSLETATPGQGDKIKNAVEEMQNKIAIAKQETSMKLANKPADVEEAQKLFAELEETLADVNESVEEGDYADAAAIIETKDATAIVADIEEAVREATAVE